MLSAGAAGGVASRVSATSWPTHALLWFDVAVLAPVAPAAACVESAASDEVAPDAWSQRSTIPAGGPKVPALFMPKNPTTRAPLALVVTDGAVTAVPLALLTPPLDVSTGSVRSTPT